MLIMSIWVPVIIKLVEMSCFPCAICQDAVADCWLNLLMNVSVLEKS